MKRALILWLGLVVAAQAQLVRVPDTMVSVTTNALTRLAPTNDTLKELVRVIDTNIDAHAVSLTNLDARVLVASTTASQALAQAGSVSTNASARTYVYLKDGTIGIQSVSTLTSGFYVDTQSLSRVHAGQIVSNAACLAATTTVVSVNWTNRFVSTDKYPIGNGTSVTGTFVQPLAGTYAHITPTGFSRCTVYVTGGGGGAAENDDESESGGAGGTSIGYWVLTAGDSNIVTVGAGGAGVTGGGTGSSGGTSSFGSLQSATGGSGGATLPDTGGSGGVGVGGALNLQGERGESDFDRAGAFEGSTYSASAWGGGYGSGGGVVSAVASNGLQGVVVVVYY